MLIFQRILKKCQLSRVSGDSSSALNDKSGTFSNSGGGGGGWSSGKDVETEKEGKTKVVDKIKKEGEDSQVLEGELAQAQGAENGQGLSWDKIKPDNLHKRVSSFGSLHDDIFKRISDRIFVMCSTNKLVDCKGL